MADDLLFQQPLALMATPRPSLARGVTGANAEALTWLERFCRPVQDHHDNHGSLAAERTQETIGWQKEQSPRMGLEATSLYLWGPPGCGKSFWTQAWAQECPGCHYVDLEDEDEALAFIQLLDQVRTKTWLIDNLHQAVNGEQLEAALFKLFVRSAETGERLVVTADRPPLQSLLQREDLRTRLGQGLIFELQELSDTEKLRALRSRAFALGWMIQPDLPDYDSLFRFMLERLPRGLDQLTALMDAADARALALKKPVGLNLIRSLMEGPIKNASA
jgi:DnaA family protein